MGKAGFRFTPLHLIGGVAAMVAMYNVYSAVQREPVHALRADNSFLEKQMQDLQTRLSDVEKENDHLKADLQHALRDTTEARKAIRYNHQAVPQHVASTGAHAVSVYSKSSTGSQGGGGGGIQSSYRGDDHESHVMGEVEAIMQHVDDHPEAVDDKCHAEPKAEYWGDVVKWGDNNLMETAGDCCKDCQNFKPASGHACNVWVWCGSPAGCNGQKHKACWLKYQPHPSIAETGANRDVSVQWTSGAIYVGGESVKDTPDRAYHVLMTANTHRYVQWQSRVCYYWYMKQKRKNPGGSMGGFTRLLHSGRPDQYMEEIPTVVVDALDNDHGFVVLSRPYAFVQWAQKFIDTIPEKYVLMSEPDHLFLRPLPNLMIGERPAAFPFFYIVPSKYPELIRKFAGNIPMSEIEVMDPIGNSPNFISKRDLARIAPVWMNVTMAIKLDHEANKAWGWVLEMWGYTIAAKIIGVSHDLHPALAAQPPWDTKIGKFYILHFTYGCDYDLDGKFTPGKIGKWRFDKRMYMGGAPPRNLPMPPKGTPELTVALVSMINEATSNIEPWRQGA
mmetsp:Transcript_63547/g.200965  ORF Transcript_63547/g.200965 Transcript_63547/m.200965 type:complete len:560 (+) Transcript_63547:123-1802(+)